MACRHPVKVIWIERKVKDKKLCGLLIQINDTVFLYDKNKDDNK